VGGGGGGYAWWGGGGGGKEKDSLGGKKEKNELRPPSRGGAPGGGTVLGRERVYTESVRRGGEGKGDCRVEERGKRGGFSLWKRERLALIAGGVGGGGVKRKGSGRTCVGDRERVPRRLLLRGEGRERSRHLGKEGGVASPGATPSVPSERGGWTHDSKSRKKKKKEGVLLRERKKGGGERKRPFVLRGRGGVRLGFWGGGQREESDAGGGRPGREKKGYRA